MSPPSLPSQPPGTPWPTTAWPEGDYPSPTVRERVRTLLDRAFDDPRELGDTYAVVIVQGGRLIEERYAPGMDAAVTQPSWSKAKSVTQALVGLLVGDGVLDPAAPARVPEWSGSGDARAAITLDMLLRMSSGLAFTEVYAPGSPSDVIEMLFGSGRSDVGAFAAAFPLSHAPDTVFSYSSGTTNIVCRLLAAASGRYGDAFEAFMRARLFDPLGMTSASPKFDESGVFIGSSFCFATPRDFARFGLLYLRGGVWEGRRLLPEGWVDYARTPRSPQPDASEGAYGAHWWVDMAGPGSFSANGFEGQFTVLVPDLDLVIVRNGRTPLELREAVPKWIAAVADAFRDA